MQRPQRRLPVVLAFRFIAVKESRLKLGNHALILPTTQPTQDGILAPTSQRSAMPRGITGRTEQDWTADEAWLSLRETGECDPLPKRSRSGRGPLVFTGVSLTAALPGGS